LHYLTESVAPVRADQPPIAPPKRSSSGLRSAQSPAGRAPTAQIPALQEPDRHGWRECRSRRSSYLPPCGRPIPSSMARPAGFEPATLGLAYQLPFSRPRHSGFVVWTISSPSQALHV